MKKLMLVSLLCMVSASVFAADDVSKTWFEHALQGLKSRVTRAYESKTVRVTAVAAVRGAETGARDPMQPYWKGGISGKAAEKFEAERKDFADALDLIVAGKTDDGAKLLMEFERKHPGSVLLPDVKEAISKLPESAAKGDADAAGIKDKKASAENKDSAKSGKDAQDKTHEPAKTDDQEK